MPVPPYALLDDPPGAGVTDVRFELLDSTLVPLGQLETLTATGITASTQGAMKRTLNGMRISQAELNEINPFTDRVMPFWQLGDGSQWPLGVYCFASLPRSIELNVPLLSATMVDQGFLLDVENEETVSIPARGLLIDCVDALLDSSGIARQNRVLPDNSDTKVLDPIGWPSTRHKTQILDELSQMGGWLPSYFDNTGLFVLRPPPNIDYTAPDISYNASEHDAIWGILENDNLLDAPNVYRVVGTGTTSGAIVGAARVSADLPYSVENRGYVIPHTTEMQGLSSNGQAQQLAEQQAASAPGFKQVQFKAIADPRHDLFMLVGYESTTYREIGFDLEFGPGGPMSHTLTQGGFPNAG